MSLMTSSASEKLERHGVALTHFDVHSEPLRILARIIAKEIMVNRNIEQRNMFPPQQLPPIRV